jgi:hypothetical protein
VKVLYQAEALITNIVFLQNGKLQVEVEIFKNPNYSRSLEQKLPRKNCLPTVLKFRVNEDLSDPIKAKRFL